MARRDAQAADAGVAGNGEDASHDGGAEPVPMKLRVEQNPPQASFLGGTRREAERPDQTVPGQADLVVRRFGVEEGEIVGPLVRGDWNTIERHLEAIAERRPQLLALYRALADTETALLGARTP